MVALNLVIGRRTPTRRRWPLVLALGGLVSRLFEQSNNSAVNLELQDWWHYPCRIRNLTWNQVAGLIIKQLPAKVSLALENESQSHKLGCRNGKWLVLIVLVEDPNAVPVPCAKTTTSLGRFLSISRMNKVQHSLLRVTYRN